MLEIREIINFVDLEQKLRQVQLLKPDTEGNQIYPYKDAHITFRQVHPGEVNPTTFYLLRKGIEQQQRLKQEIEENKLDFFRLPGALVYTTEDGTRTLLPPIIEVQEEVVKYENPRGDKRYDASFRVQVPIINDGAHRIYVAKMHDELPLVCCISNISPEFPFYSLPNHWDDVKIVDEVPLEKEKKKLYRRVDNYALYRNFDSVFEGCSKPRK